MSRCCGSSSGCGGINPNKPQENAWNEEDTKQQQQQQYGKDHPTPPFTYTGSNLYAIDFPLGGFGAGNVNLAGDGSLQHWSILNQVQVNGNWRDNPMPACWFGIQAAPVRTIRDTLTNSPSAPFESLLRTKTNSTKAFHDNSILPAIDSLTLTGRYPIANLDYNLKGCSSSKSSDLRLSMEAMCPLIPGDVKNSSLPCAIFTFKVENPTDESQEVRLLASQLNFVGWNGHDKIIDMDNDDKTSMPGWGGNVNTPFVSTRGENENSSKSGPVEEGLLLTSNNTGPSPENPSSGTLCLTAVHTPESLSSISTQSKTNISVITAADNETDLWQHFVDNKDIPVKQAGPSNPSPTGKTTCCGVVQSVTLAPHSKANLTFCLSWHFPNRMASGSITGWNDQQAKAIWEKLLPSRLGNYYSTHWFPKDAQQVSKYVAANLQHLVDTTRLYRDTLYNSTIPPELLDCAAGRVSTLRSPTMWYTGDGIVLGSEGNGCCPLNCTHVYGYTTLMERLFPSLAQNMRISDFVRTYDAPDHASRYCGGVPMRYGAGGWAIDGALASIIKTYLVVQQSDPDAAFLRQVWPNVKDQMKRILTYFDTQGDGVIRGLQQNTYDAAMAGANTFIGSYVVTALKATARMADIMGEADLAKTFQEHAELAATNYEAICWEDSYGYYIADVTEKNSAQSYGRGCHLDQLCAVGLSSACGFGHIFNPQHEALARRNILKYNKVTKPPFQDFQGHFYNGDTGLHLLSFPHGKFSVGDWQYRNLVSSGFTSSFIAGLLLDGNVDDACETAFNLRMRQDGRNASPWNEPECGSLYSRAMAHWNIFDQACGFRHSCNSDDRDEMCLDSSASPRGGHVSFDPRFQASDFHCFVTLYGGWGEFRQQGVPCNGSLATGIVTKPRRGLASGSCTLECLHGSFRIASLGFNTDAANVRATLDDKDIKVTFLSDGIASFRETVTVAQGSSLRLVFGDGDKATTLLRDNTLCRQSTKDSSMPATSSGMHRLLHSLALIALALLVHEMLKRFGIGVY